MHFEGVAVFGFTGALFLGNVVFDTYYLSVAQQT